MRKSILFLGGGELGLPVLKWAKEIGFYIIINDQNPNAPGIKFADTIINFDSTDVRNISNWVLKNNYEYNIQYCYTGSDFGLLTSTVIHHILNLPTNPLHSIFNGLDKTLMKRSWKGSGILYPKSKVVRNLSDVYEIVNLLGVPIVIKPTDSSGSRGVSIVDEMNNIGNAFNEALKYAETGEIIVEEYINGTHHDVNGLFWKGKFFPCGVGDRFFTPIPYPVPHHGYFPSRLVNSKKDELYNFLKMGAISMGIVNGPVKADFVIDKNGTCYAYEISPRFHGDVFTTRTMGFLNKKNPIYQFLRMIYNPNDLVFYDIDNTTSIGCWKTIFNSSDIPDTRDCDIHIINQETSSIIKNNTQIMGLSWCYKKNFEEIRNFFFNK